MWKVSKTLPFVSAFDFSSTFDNIAKALFFSRCPFFPNAKINKSFYKLYLGEIVHTSFPFISRSLSVSFLLFRHTQLRIIQKHICEQHNTHIRAWRYIYVYIHMLHKHTCDGWNLLGCCYICHVLKPHENSVFPLSPHSVSKFFCYNRNCLKKNICSMSLMTRFAQDVVTSVYLPVRWFPEKVYHHWVVRLRGKYKDIKSRHSNRICMYT